MKWFDIKGYEGLYQINKNGEVRSLPHYTKFKNGTSYHNGKLLKLHDNGKGYLKVDLCKDGKQKRFFIHRLVAGTFIENPNNYPQVNHINGNKKDNRVENLEWVSASTNVKHAVSMGLFHITEDKNLWKLTEEDALETLNNAILEGNSIVINPRDFGVYKSVFQKVEVEWWERKD